MADDDVIYVDIEPKLNDSATEKEANRLRDKFKRHSKVDIEPNLDEAATDRATGRLRDRIKSASGGMRDALDDLFDKATDKAADRATDKAADKMRRKLDGIGKSFGDALGNEFGNLFNDGSPGVGSELGKAFQKHFGGIQDLFSGGINLDDPLGQFNEIKGNLREIAEGLSGLAPEASGAATALAAVAEAAGPLSVALAGIAGGIWGINKLGMNWMAEGAGAPPPGVDPKKWYDFTHSSSTDGSGLFPHAPGESSEQSLQDLLGGGSSSAPSRGGGAPKMGPPITPTPGPGWAPGTTGGQTLLPPGTPATRPNDLGGLMGGTAGFTSGGGIHATLVDYTHPSAPSISGPSDIPGAAGGVRNLFAVAQSLVGTPYSQQLRNDCSGMVSQIAAAAVGLPAPAAGQRFSTVNEGQALAGMGFQQGMGGPGDLSIGWYDHGGGNFGHTAATLPGGINAESGGSAGAFALGGQVGAGSPQFDQHMFLPMSAGGGGAGARPAGFGGIPGIPGMGGMGPLPPPTQSNTGNSGPISQQHLGQGQGAGVSGGGLIGAAEQAGVMAAAIGGFGGGGVAAQIAEQEINLAVQKTSQLAYAAASAPLETLWLSGGQMGAPSVQSPAFGWPGKLLSGLIGSQYSSPNTAGAVQAPKQPQQKPPGQPGQDDPGNGNKSAGPTGHADDPIHTKSADPKQGPPQGAATDAASVSAMAGLVAA